MRLKSAQIENFQSWVPRKRTFSTIYIIHFVNDVSNRLQEKKEEAWDTVQLLTVPLHSLSKGFLHFLYFLVCSVFEASHFVEVGPSRMWATWGPNVFLTPDPVISPLPVFLTPGPVFLTLGFSISLTSCFSPLPPCVVDPWVCFLDPLSGFSDPLSGLSDPWPCFSNPDPSPPHTSCRLLPARLLSTGSWLALPGCLHWLKCFHWLPSLAQLFNLLSSLASSFLYWLSACLNWLPSLAQVLSLSGCLHWLKCFHWLPSLAQLFNWLSSLAASCPLALTGCLHWLKCLNWLPSLAQVP